MTTAGPSLRLSKIDAARRQLVTAVRLYFCDEDPVAIHTLVSAAHAVLSDLNHAAAGHPTLKDVIARQVRPDQAKEVRRQLNAAANFFKHANTDPKATFELLTSQTEVFTLDACLKYRELSGELVPVLGVYETWFWLGPGAQFVDVTTGQAIERFRVAFKGASRSSYFHAALTIGRAAQKLDQSPLEK